MSSYLSSFLSSAFGTGAAFDSSDESDGENLSPVNATTKPSSSSASSTTTKAVSKPTSSGDAESSSVHWLGVETDEKEVRVVCDNRAAKEVLGKCSDTTPLNLISIFGAARQGKSFLMNMLAGEDRLFKISSSQDPCTQGVDLSRKVISWGSFHRHDEIAMKKHERRSIDHASSEPAPKIAFVDVEGQGDRDLTYDANLVCPVVLTSRCVIFNWKDSLQRDRLLNLLAVMQRAAFNVATEEEEDGDGSEGGGRGGKATTSAPQPKIFGHLHIVFRDWAYDGTKDTVYKTLFTQERSLAPDAVARNQIRSVLENAFESISIWLLPPPVERTTDLNKELRANDLSDTFKQQVTALRHALAEQVKTPHHFCGKVLTGPKIASLVPALVQTLNDGNQVLPRSAYANLIAAEVTRVQASYLKKLQKALAAVKQQATITPLATGELQAQVMREVHQLQRDFDHWLHSLGDAATATEAAEAFQEHCTKGTEEVVKYNREHLLVAHLHAAGKKAQGEFDASFTNTISARLPMAPEKLVASQQNALGKAEGGVRAVVGGEVDLQGLPLDDVLSSLRTHAALALTKVEEQNKQQLARVQQQEQEGYEAAKTTFQESFFSALSSLKATGQPIAETEFSRAYDAALSAAKKRLQGGMHAEMTPVSRTKELETFLVNACEGIKGEQGAMYQLGTAKALLAKAKEEGEEEVRRVEARGKEERMRLEGELEEARREIERLKREAEMAGKTQNARVRDLQGHVKSLEIKTEDLKKEKKMFEEKYEEAAKATSDAKGQLNSWKGEVEMLEKANELLKTQRDRLVQEKERLAGEKESLQQEVVQSSKKRKAAEEEAERAVKARREVDAEAAAAQAAATAAAAQVAAAAAAAAVAAKQEHDEEEEEEEGQGMEVEDSASVKEEEQEAAPQEKKKKATAAAAAKPKGRATPAKGRASAAKPALSPAAQRKLVEEAREEERKRIEESTAKRVTRTRK